MFTGIVQGRGIISAVEDFAGLRRLSVRLPEGRAAGLQTGASISIAGVCLTVVAFDDDTVQFDVIDETLRLTRLGELAVGAEVNIERAATFGDEIGGHLLSGHVLGLATVVRRQDSQNNLALWLRAPDNAVPYVIHKGYIGVEGCSLTVGEVADGVFSLHLIPETLRLTTLGALQPGDRVNLEVDALTQAAVDTVTRVLQQREAR